MIDTSVMFGFSTGEVSPAFYGRADLAKSGMGLKLARNFYVDYKGGLSNRPGTQFIAELIGLELDEVKLVPFKTTFDDYLLMFCENRVYVLQNGGFLTKETVVPTLINSTTFSSPTALMDGEWVWVNTNDRQVVGGLRQVNVVSGGAYQLTDGNTPFPVTGMTSLRRLVSVTTNLASVLSRAKFEQDGADLIITANGVSKKKLTYVTPTSWTFQNFSTEMTIATRPVITGLDRSSTTGTAAVAFRVSAVVGGIEGLPSIQAPAYSIVDYSTEKGWVKVNWNAVPGAEYYRVYRSLIQLNGTVQDPMPMGYIGQTKALAFTDSNIVPDFTKGPISDSDPFEGAGFNDPAIYLRYQQRGVFAATTKLPTTVWGSTVGTNNIFSGSIPAGPSDAYSHTIDSTSPQALLHLLPNRNGLLVFAREMISLLRGVDGRAVNNNAVLDPLIAITASKLPPLLHGNEVLFFNDQNTALYALVPESGNSLVPQDISVLANHLFSYLNPIEDRAATEDGRKLLYFLRADGKAPVLTYDREQEVFGWAMYETKGLYRQLVSVREGPKKTCYFLIERRLGGKKRLFLEREADRITSPIEDAFFVDCGLSRSTQSFAEEFSFVGTSEEAAEVTRGNSAFAALPTSAVMYAGQRRFRKSGPATVQRLNGPKFSPGEEENYPQGLVTYATPTSVVKGLWHLEGEKVSVLADGSYLEGLVVEDGQVSISPPAGKVVVGLPYSSKGETLPLTLLSQRIEGKVRRPLDIALRVMETRGLQVGKSFRDLYELRERTAEQFGETPFIQSNTLKDFFGTQWASDTTVCFQQQYPLPVTILGLAVDLEVGGR